MILTIMLMAGGSLLIGILPTFNQVGWLAPILLLLARMLGLVGLWLLRRPRSGTSRRARRSRFSPSSRCRRSRAAS